MSYASMGANAVYNILEQGDVVMVAEGLDVFRVDVPPKLVGKTLQETEIRGETGCSVVALETAANETIINPPADLPLPGNGAELILVGTTESQREFVARYLD
jgi:K+/H+ antiporter YhaU regulatory subunit KhtT